MRSMFNPAHPGLTLKDDILPALNLQLGEAAAQLGVDRPTLSKVLNGWAAYDLWQARSAVKASKALSGVKTLKLQPA